MGAKTLIVGLVTVVSLMLFTGAVYANQLAARPEHTTQASSGAHQEEHAWMHEHHGHV
jgi:hypothetical protein